MARFRCEHSNGKTRVFDVLTGKEIEDIVRVEFTHDPRHGPVLLVTQVDHRPGVSIGLASEVSAEVGGYMFAPSVEDIVGVQSAPIENGPIENGDIKERRVRFREFI
jgi:predicted ATP-grasp superfamily ATP-dependent carboligase